MAKTDLSEFYKYSRPKKRPCALGFALDQLAASEQEQLKAALTTDSGLITAGSVQQWLAARKHEVTTSAVVAHRKGTCSCGRS